MQEVGSGIFRAGCSRINWYLLQEGSSLTLVDCGLPGQWHVLAESVSRLGRRLSDVEALLLTHAHTDHAGSAERVRREAGAQVHVHAAEIPLIRGGRPSRKERSVLLYVWRPAALATLWTLLHGGGLRMEHVPEVVEVVDGTQLDVPGQPRVVHVPGHTSGSVGYLLDDRESFFSGDAVVTLNPLTGRRGPQLLPRGFTENSVQALASLERVSALTASTLLPGHGPPWRGSMA
ncbi:MAG: MBL fold metallo-hydrolase, partial [Chloroflexi bacterium]|nr:MBL fold metallo-hydrolase [Chloroflexota bacterium]